ncbi:DNA polymerase-4 [Chitinivorax tropicus]|uniref:DNA polymerase IV n=1 Tax=Chitinivorax tropicus TaxID=714531 RepID=A0A840MF57_9PROT|nr:DNA polymerase IV [Chitinivorax tropicus]MBB5017030.1 DNA polymerase-4 [Chitinivorax tropicus]
MPPQRKIIHVDCDCFYAAIEMLDDPNLRGKPIAVGGRQEARGVIATCNYEARAFGVRSAMPTSRALKLCPKLILIRPRADRYRAVSKQVRQIYESFTDRIEPLSLDEAYLDVTGVGLCQGSATFMAEAIRQRIREEIGITASAGIAPNKFLAKIASDWHKPDGQFVIRPQEVDAFVKVLPVGKLFGVGKVTEARMHKMGLFTCEDLRSLSPTELSHRFGAFGERLWQLAHGVDEREVVTDEPRKSLSVETTFVTDLPDAATCKAELPALFDDLLKRLARVETRYRVNKAYFKMKFADFSQTTMELAATSPDLNTYNQMCEICHQRRHQPVRLVGIGVRFVIQHDDIQPSLF